MAHFTSPLGSSEHSTTDQSASSPGNFAAVMLASFFLLGHTRFRKRKLQFSRMRPRVSGSVLPFLPAERQEWPVFPHIVRPRFLCQGFVNRLGSLGPRATPLPRSYSSFKRTWERHSIPQCTAPGGKSEQSSTRQSLQPSSLNGQWATTMVASRSCSEQWTFWG